MTNDQSLKYDDSCTYTMPTMRTAEKTINILVTEDVNGHQVDCREALGHFQNLNITLVPYLESAYKALARTGDEQIHAVITDVFFPHSGTNDRGLDSPISATILIAQSLNMQIPYVVNTSAYHHGKRGQLFRTQHALMLHARKVSGEELSQGWGRVFEVAPNSVNDAAQFFTSGSSAAGYDFVEKQGRKQWPAVLAYVTLLVESRRAGNILDAFFSKVMTASACETDAIFLFKKILDLDHDNAYPMCEWIANEDTRKGIEFVRLILPTYAPRVFG